MAAFMRGDYAAAEIGFNENLRCIQRVERVQELAYDQAIANSITAEVNAQSPSAGSIPGQNIESAAARQLSTMPQGYNTRRRDNRPLPVREHTCEQPEWQHYMIGLSQIQLGRLEEARQSFYRTITLSKHRNLYDAYFRIGLLELVLNNDVARAERQLEALERMQNVCELQGWDCDLHAELDGDVEDLRFAIAEARAQARP
jgi:tetratricopeptide (TPR) repeat protein